MPTNTFYYADTHIHVLKLTGLLGYGDELFYPALTKRAAFLVNSSCVARNARRTPFDFDSSTPIFDLGSLVRISTSAENVLAVLPKGSLKS